MLSDKVKAILGAGRAKAALPKTASFSRGGNRWSRKWESKSHRWGPWQDARGGARPIFLGELAELVAAADCK